MRTVFLILTTRCNRSCSYCFYETGYQHRGDRSIALHVDEGMLASLREAGVDKLIFTGGEPLLAPGAAGIVKTASDMGFYTLLLTNGDLLDPPCMDRMVDSGLDAVTISLDAPAEGEESKAPWELLHRMKSSVDVACAVITPVTRRNIGSMPEIMKRISSMGLYLLVQPVFVPPDNQHHSRLSMSASTPDEMKKFMSILRLWISLYGPSGYADLVRRFYTSGQDVKPSHCTFGTDASVIDSNGDLMPCFHRRDLVAGNVFASKPASVVQSCFELGKPLRSAPCFGEHCISLFSHL